MWDVVAYELLTKYLVGINNGKARKRSQMHARKHTAKERLQALGREGQLHDAEQRNSVEEWQWRAVESRRDPTCTVMIRCSLQCLKPFVII